MNESVDDDGSMGNDDDSIDSEATTKFDSDIVIYT
jgi:hypothetical protein